MIVLKLKKKNTDPDNMIEHFSCLKRNIRARYILNSVYYIRSVYSLFKLTAYRHALLMPLICYLNF